MSTKFTPGPWTIQEHWGKGKDEPDSARHLCFHSINAADRWVASTWQGPNLADAQLIAASPEMLNALYQALEDFNPKECNCDGGYGDDGSQGRACYFHRIEEHVRQAIAKATGGGK